MSDIAIRVENCILSRVEGLSKRYHIGRAQQRHDTLRDALVSTFKRFNDRKSSPASPSRRAAGSRPA